MRFAQKICIKRKEKKKSESRIESSEVETRYFPDVVNAAMRSIGEYKDDEGMNFLVRAQQEASDLPRSSLERGEVFPSPPFTYRIVVVQKYALHPCDSRFGRSYA